MFPIVSILLHIVSSDVVEGDKTLVLIIRKVAVTLTVLPQGFGTDNNVLLLLDILHVALLMDVRIHVTAIGCSLLIQCPQDQSIL